MTRINLLPWREELRKERQKQFGFMLVGAALAGVAIWGLGHLHYTGLIDNQNNRNQVLEREIKDLEVRIAKIKDLKATKDRLIARMRVIEQLQQGRPQIVHMFEELVTTLPDGVYLTSVKQSGVNLTLSGIAESNARISSFMENLDKSPWLADPRLNVIQVKDMKGPGRSTARVSDYVLLVKQEAPSAGVAKPGQKPGT